MPHTVYLDKESYYQVVGDYSGSPRHSALSEEAWKLEFERDPAYAGMKKAYPEAVAGITPQGIGLWTKDWTLKAEGVGCCR